MCEVSAGKENSIVSILRVQCTTAHERGVTPTVNLFVGNILGEVFLQGQAEPTLLSSWTEGLVPSGASFSE